MTVRLAWLPLLLIGTPLLAQDAAPAAAPNAPTARGVRTGLEALLPGGVTILTVEAQGPRWRVTGTTTSNEILSNYLRALDADAAFAIPELFEVAAEGSQYRYALGISVECEAPGAGKSPACGGAAPPKQQIYKCMINGTVSFQARPCPE